MSLDVYISSTKKINYEAEGLDFTLEDDGYYWYMFPFFESIRKSHNLMIDLYGYEIFFEKDLNILETQMLKISKSIEDKPEVWEVKVGERNFILKKVELFNYVNKKQFKELIQKFLNGIERARNDGKYLIFYGD